MKKVVITGDSLSYNRYDYDEIPRVNAWDCHIGMGSWSFALRNKLITGTKCFQYADGLRFAEPSVADTCDIADSIFGQRVRTIAPVNGRIHFSAQSDTGMLVFYFQKHPQNGCCFSLSVDGVPIEEPVDTRGDLTRYQGYDLLVVSAPCSRDRTSHEVVLSDFACDGDPLVTLAGVSGERMEVAITGQGGRTAQFLLENFEERIGAYAPDTLILIFGGNDCLVYSVQEYRRYLEELFRKVTDRFPDCRIVTLTIPPSAYCGETIFADQEDMDRKQGQYNSAMQEVSRAFGAISIDTASVFQGVLPSVWRYDNVHFTKVGNEMLFRYLCDLLKIEKGA